MTAYDNFCDVRALCRFFPKPPFVQLALSVGLGDKQVIFRIC